MPALGQLKARMSQTMISAIRNTTTTRDVRRRGIYDMLEQDCRIYRTLYAYQIPKQILKTAATVCSPWWR